MAGLKMRYREPLPHTMPVLPEGYALCTLETEEDLQGCFYACTEGLSLEEWTLEQFREVSLDRVGIEKEQMYMIRDPQGKIVATATAWQRGETEGYLHLVSALPEVRGMGFGYILCQKVLDFFLDQGITSIQLDTQDFRLPAIKVYLKLGFIPVLYDYDMADRWRDVFDKLQLRTPVYRLRFEEMEL